MNATSTIPDSAIARPAHSGRGRLSGTWRVYDLTRRPALAQRVAQRTALLLTAAARPPIVSGMRSPTALLIGAALFTAALAWAPAVPTARADEAPAFGSRLYVDPTSDAQRAYEALTARGEMGTAALIEPIAGQPTAVWLGDWYTPTLLLSVMQRHLARPPPSMRRRCSSPTPSRIATAAGTPPAASRGPVPRMESHHRRRTRGDPRRRARRAGLAGDARERRNAGASPHPVRRYPFGGEDPRLGRADHLPRRRKRPLAGPRRAGRPAERRGHRRRARLLHQCLELRPTQSERDYAGKVSSRVGWKHFIIDVSRNGNGWTGTWCNPPGAALGQDPQSPKENTAKLDALLWVKHPGASDGDCNGGQAAGAS